MKKVLHLIETSGPGGAEKVLISLVEHLDRRQFKSIVCLLKDGWLNSQLQNRGIKTIIVPQTKSLDLGWLYKIIKIIRIHKVNLMHAHEFTMNTYGSILSLVVGIPLIATVHGKNYYSGKLRRRIAYRFVSRWSAQMVAVSKDIKGFLENAIGIRSDLVKVVYNGIAKNDETNKDRGEVKKELAIREAGPVIGTIGNLYPVKGQTYLLRAAARVVSVIPDANFLIVGRGALLDKLKEEANHLNISENLKFLGFRDDIPSLLEMMDLFVLPSLSEGLSLALLEAMSAGKPTIATRVGGNAEIILDGETGLLIPPEDPVSLAENIIRLIREKSLAKKMGDAARTRIEREFSLASMISNYEELYRNYSH